MKPIVFIVLIFLSIQVSAGTPGEVNSLRKCAEQWEGHPFGRITEKTRFTKLDAKVKVLGIGGATVDERKTKKPRLILISSNVSVLSKATYRLMNPNGYYCFRGKVTVLSKAEIVAHCKAHVAAAQGANVLGSTSKAPKSGGVTVLGKTVVRRVHCKGKADPIEEDG